VQRIGLLLVILAVGAGVWYLITRDDVTTVTSIPDTPEAAPPSKGEGGLEGNKSASGVGDGALPHLLALPSAARVLLVGKHQGSWPELMVHAFQQIRELEYRTWYTHDVATRKPGAGVGRGMEELKALPTAEYLEAQDVRALFLDSVDPNVFPETFWNVVTARVESGRMGLYIRPGFPVGEGGASVTQHPALTHPALKALLPIERAALLQGSPTPGVESGGRALRVTTVGMEHPATRLVDNTTASQRVWDRASSGTGSFAAVFCYPVLDLKPGAKTLVEWQAATSVPAVVSSADGEARVLWMGNVDFGQRTYFVRSKDSIQKLLANHWILWLVGERK
jgi:hypothetical protein